MRFQIEKKELLHHIQHLASIVPSKNTTPILTNYLLEAVADSNLVKITASDLEITVIAEFSATVIEGGTTTISARSFNEIVSSMPDSVLDIYKQDEVIKIHCDKIDFSLLCADYTLFPIIPEKSMQNALKVPSENFQRMINKTSFAVSSDINRAVLNGVCWFIKSDYQIMAATDGRKVAEIKYLESLAMSEISGKKAKSKKASEADDTAEIAEDIDLTEMNYEKGIEKILPIKTLNFLQKIHSADFKELLVVIEPNRVMFEYGEYTIFSHVIEHKYPDYQKAFISDLPNVLIINKDILKTAIRRIALIAPEDNLRIRFELGPDKFEINTTNREAGEGKQIMDKFNYTGSGTTIAFNNKYMISILDSIDTDNVKISIGTQKDPIMIYNETQPEKQEITYLLMPLRS
ncbi:MAG: DNA polymerase III subunit beta [Candidatus Cloacimonadaceae bacterium]